jgi:glycosyltransferase involved in cell wall biosynthesis
MRIAIYHELPSGGAKRALYEVARRLAQTHTVDVYTLSTANLAFCDLRPVVRRHVVVPFRPLAQFASPFGRLNQGQRWRDLHRLDHLSCQTAAEIDRGSYQVVYANPSQYTQAPSILNYLSTPSVYQANEPLRMAYEAGIPRPYHNAGWRTRLDLIDPLLRLYRRRLAAVDHRNTLRATVLLANSQFTADNLLRIYGRAASVGYPGIDPASFRPAADPHRQGYVLSVGALRPNKGFDFLIQALAQIPPERRPPLRLVGNADDPLERVFLANLASHLGVDLNIETGATQETLVQRYYEAALVLYAPVAEPLGFVPLEAAACGTAVVAVADGGIQETVVPGLTGLLTWRDPADFAAAVQTLLSDAGRREQLGRHGREWVAQNWTWDRTMASVEAALVKAAEP